MSDVVFCVQELDKAYRERKKARLAAERREARIAAGLPPDSPPRPKKEPKEPRREEAKPRREEPPPPPPRFYPEVAVKCEADGCGKWRKVSRRVASSMGPRDRWVCAFDRSVPAEERAFACDRPCVWSSDEDRLSWRSEMIAAEATARSNGAEIDGDPPPAQLCEPDGTPDGTPEKAHRKHGGRAAPPPPPDFANAEEEAEWRRRRHEERTGVHLLTKEEAGIQTDLPRGTVSGYAAEQMTEEDEDEHEPAGRVDGDIRSAPPQRARGQPAASVPAVCGGVDGVYLARRAMFRCMCGPDLENCVAKSGDGDGVVMTTTAFERHCGMEKSKNWRNSCSVLCHGGAKVKIGIWLDEVGIDVARGKGGGGGGGPGARAPPKEHKTKEPKGPARDTRWQPRRPGPFDNLPLRHVMAALEIVMDTEGGTPASGRQAIARASTVCKAWMCAAQTVVKSRGVEKWCPEIERKKKNEEEDGDDAEVNAEREAEGAVPTMEHAVADDTAPAPVPMDTGAGTDVDAPPVAASGSPPTDAKKKKSSSSHHVKWTTEADYTATRAQLEEIYDYVPRGDPTEVDRERTVTLAADHPRRGRNGTVGSPRNVKKKPGPKSAKVRFYPPVTLKYPITTQLQPITDQSHHPHALTQDHVSLKHPGMDAIDRRVKVFWPEENAFFTGIVSKYDRKTEKHTVTYDDGDVEEVTLAKERMEWLEPGGDSLHPASENVIVHANGDVSDPAKPPVSSS